MSRQDWTGVMGKIREELSSLAKFIDKSRNGIDTIETTVRIGSEQFPEASSQLSAVTGDLENAANKIMSIVEAHMAEQDRAGAILKKLAGWSADPGVEPGAGAALTSELAAINAKSKEDMMELFSHMSFQDLTGQKLKKVINSLAIVEKKLLEIAMSFGLEDSGDRCDKSKAAPEIRVNQDIVDKLLKELGT